VCTLYCSLHKVIQEFKVEPRDHFVFLLEKMVKDIAVAATAAPNEQSGAEGRDEGGGDTTTTSVGVVVCCGCFAPRRQRYRRTESSVPAGADLLQQSTSRRESIYHDAVQDLEDLSFSQAASSSLAYFDAFEDADWMLSEDDYPTIPTVSIPKRLHRVSMIEPETLLRPTGPRRPQEDEYEATVCVSASRRNVIPASSSSTSSHSSAAHHHHGHSLKLGGLKNKVFRRGSFLAQQELEKPRIALSERGYPGQLNPEELAQCLQFYREIHQQPALLEIVYSFSKVEEEPYGICRFMRATKFDAAAILLRLQQGTPMWQQAKEQQFYPHLHQAIGVPLPLFLEMYPFFYHGNAKNGCPVSYFKAGKINPEGLLCMSTVDQAPRYYWHLFYYTFQDMIVRAKQKNENLVRCEAINVVDLKGMSSSQMTSEAMDVMKKVAAISNFFPETLHCMVILNAPAWFGMTWPIIKSFIDPRTAKKIEVYSREATGKARLLELINVDEIPADYGGTAPTTDVLMANDDKNKKQKSQSSGISGSGGTTSDSGKVDQEEEDDEDKVLRRAVEVVFLKKNETKKFDNFVQVNAGEVVKIQVYTRSITAAEVSVTMAKEDENDDDIGNGSSRPSGNNNHYNNIRRRSSSQDAAENTVNITDAPVHIGRAEDESATTLSEYNEENMPKPFKTDICHNIAGPRTMHLDIKGKDSLPAAAAANNKKLSQGYFLIVATVTPRSTGVESSP
jgi:CRAL/TRIO domain